MAYVKATFNRGINFLALIGQCICYLLVNAVWFIARRMPRLISSQAARTLLVMKDVNAASKIDATAVAHLEWSDFGHARFAVTLRQVTLSPRQTVHISTDAWFKAYLLRCAAKELVSRQCFDELFVELKPSKADGPVDLSGLNGSPSNKRAAV